MKTLTKMHLLEIHVNPINRDLIMVVTVAMLVSITLISVGMMIISQI
ncbi:MAG: hypothetical protein JJE09_12815 [Bacteroidia bacterium]|nr:hypothetical protein [Bacteroidia bacterium]